MRIIMVYLVILAQVLAVGGLLAAWRSRKSLDNHAAPQRIPKGEVRRMMRALRKTPKSGALEGAADMVRMGMTMKAPVGTNNEN